MFDYEAKSPVVFLSGGADSVVVLDEVIKHHPNIEAVTFNQDFTKPQWQIIENLLDKYEVELHTFPPNQSYLIEREGRLAKVDEYGLNDFLFPVVRDLVEGERCLHDLDPRRIENVPFPYDVVFVGTRKEDADPAIRPMAQPVIKQHGITFVAPLWEWTKEQVLERARELPISKEFYEQGKEEFDTGNLIACSRCYQGQAYCPKEMKVIPKVEWDKDRNLEYFRTR